MPPLKHGYVDTAGPEYTNIAGEYEKDIKTVCTDVIEDLQEKMNVFLKETQEKTSKQ